MTADSLLRVSKTVEPIIEMLFRKLADTHQLGNRSSEFLNLSNPFGESKTIPFRLSLVLGLQRYETILFGECCWFVSQLRINLLTG